MSRTVHPLVDGFGPVADAYERGRPSYPPDAVGAIAGFLGLGPGRRVIDLGAGTGKLTRLLIPSGATVVAVEPVAGMRDVLEARAPGVELLDGTAEALPVANGSVAGVVIAQAFHWFDTVRALSELHRVLEPGGGFAIIVNRRDESVPWVARLTRMLEAATGGESPVDTIDWRERIRWSGLFESFEELEFRHVHRLPVDGVIDRVASISTVADLEAPARAALLAEVRVMLAEEPDTAGRAEVELPYATYVLRYRSRTPEPGAEGLVASVNRNDGGIPKAPVEGARIGSLGLEGDGHHHPEIHGGERGAVCLYAQEAIERVRADGHQAFPGAFGENLTLLGIDWAGLAEGDRLVLGDGDDGPLLELTQPTTPCRTQARWFIDGRFGRISHAAHPEDARWYARVLREGEVAPGSAVRLLPRG